jgi:hypothetical protein
MRERRDWTNYAQDVFPMYAAPFSLDTLERARNVLTRSNISPIARENSTRLLNIEYPSIFPNTKPSTPPKDKPKPKQETWDSYFK